MQADEMPGCCGIRIISEIFPLVEGDDAYSQREAAKFPELIKPHAKCKGQFDGEFTRASLLTINNDPYDLTVAQRRKLIAIVRKHGFVKLAQYRSDHGNYQVFLYGKGFRKAK